MGVFVHEFFSSGAYGGDFTQSSLAPEGLAMLGAVLEDVARCPASHSGGRAFTTLDRRLKTELQNTRFTEWADVHWAESAEHEQILFQKLTAQAEATFVIAPESDGILLARRVLVERAGGRFLGHSVDAIRLCSDKLAFCEHLQRHDLPTIPTRLFDPAVEESTVGFPLVVKPRDGAGSQDTYLVRNAQHLARLRGTFSAAFGQRGREAILQPFIAGQSLSVAAIAATRSGSVEVFPIGQQRLSDDGRFQYQGGMIPVLLPQPLEVSDLVARLCRSMTGLAGYIGFDLILTEQSPRLLIVEANPRLTTAYLGYRALANENLAARIRQPARTPNPIAWSAGAVEFEPDGLLRPVSRCLGG